MKEIIQAGSGNVFADLRLPLPEELHAKAKIAVRICQILEKRRITQKKAAAILGIDQPKVSSLMHGRLEGFSTERLFRFLNSLDQDVEIVIKQSKSRSHQGSIRVALA
jgi:predicted XRE-type DNA-binding protein